MKRVVLFSLLSVFILTSTGMAADTYKIGVLAKRGSVKAIKQWKATGEYLTAKIKGKSFEVVPLDFDQVNPAIEKNEVAFFLINSSMFITAKVNYGASAIATMVNSRQGKPLKSFGGVIFTSAENDKINSMADLKGKSFMAVKKSSFGGWQMALKEILGAGLNPSADFSKMEFGGKHDNVVLAIQNEAVEAGTVRTDTLERMIAEGLVEMDEFKIINKQKHDGFPFVCSTALYPEWPLAKCQATDDAVAQEVVEALKQMKADDKAAKDAKVIGWVEALDYNPVEELQKSLKIGAYSE